MTTELAGRVALITGATGGIGTAISTRLARLGARIAVHTSAPRPVDLHAFGPDAFSLAGDVDHDADRIVADVIAVAGRIDILVNNAGIWPSTSLLDSNRTDREVPAGGPDPVTETIRVNLLGVAAMTAAAASAMASGSAICNVSSIEAFGAPAHHGAYAASKAGVLGHTRAAAVELGPLGIRVNAVAPGLIRRPGIDSDWPHGVSRWTTACPLGRLGDPDDVAAAVAFLVGPDARWITGTCLTVDGGVSARSPW